MISSAPPRRALRTAQAKLGAYAEIDPGRATTLPGPRGFRPHPVLAELVEDIWDWDVPDVAVANNLIFRNPPSASLLLVFHYCAPAVSDRAFGAANYQSPPWQYIALKLESGIFTIRPTAPIGSVVVRLKPESAELVMKAPMQAFMNTKVHLYDLFSARKIDLLNEAGGSVARIGIVQDFLFEQASPLRPNPVLRQAAARLRSDPSLKVAQLAAELDVSERNLSRTFKATLGAGPKHFARLMRVEKAVEARRNGAGWTDIAYDLGFVDQAHLIRDFNAITGSAPEKIFRAPMSAERSDDRLLNAPVFVSRLVEQPARAPEE